MDAITYLKEKERLTKCSGDGYDCSKCRLCILNNESKVSCVVLESRHPEEAVRIIEGWSKEMD